MSNDIKVRISVPSVVERGSVIQIKTLAAHPMETGFRRDTLGRSIPRNILTSFDCSFDGAQVFHAEFHPAVAANPFLAFHFKPPHDGTLKFVWRDQSSIVALETRQISVK